MEIPGQFSAEIDTASPEALVGVQSRIAHAYWYFLEEVRKWLAPGPAKGRADALSTAIREQVRMIVLDLDNTDEPQAIFETLNAHGTPLLPADLVKNWLLWDAARNKVPLDKLYRQYWQPFDHTHDFWRAEVGTGHARRARIDSFLQNWLTMRCKEMVPAKHLYDRFVKRMEEERNDGGAACDVASVMSDISANSGRFRTLVEPTGKTRFDAFLRRLSTMGLVILHPFLLAVLGREDIDQNGRDRIALMLESYLVRRMICDLETRSYNVLCLALIDALNASGSDERSYGVLTGLTNPDSKSIHWPTDAEFAETWLKRQFYGSLRRERVVMILQAIEQSYQVENVKGEPVLQFDYDKLQIEHIMPQAWREHWHVESESAAKYRDSRINTIGNLTLVSEKLNPSLSHSPWLGSPSALKGKKSALDDHSILRMNAKLVKGHPDVWDEVGMDARALLLLETAKTIWPPTSAFAL
jgi:hypothetical protein